MRLLLDTHALIWWLEGNTRLPPRCRAAIADARNDVRVSVASIWEIGIKAANGKLPSCVPFVGRWRQYLASQSFETVEVGVDHVDRASTLPPLHKDPFDRLLVAQALSGNYRLVTIEELFERYGVERYW
jgi:PIN domain nuclease of toxin-antitoxin system